MRELLSKQNLDYQERAREVAEKYVRPLAAELDRTGEYGWDILEALKSYDLTGVWIPEEYGGKGAGVLDLCLVVEELSRACGGVGVAYAVNALGSFPIILGGTEEQKQKYLPGIASGENSDRLRPLRKGLGIRRRQPAHRRRSQDGDDYVINGEKKWNTNGDVASVYTVYALTDPDRGDPRHLGLHGGEGHARLRGRQARGHHGDPQRAGERAPLRRLPRAGRTTAGRQGRRRLQATP